MVDLREPGTKQTIATESRTVFMTFFEVFGEAWSWCKGLANRLTRALARFWLPRMFRNVARAVSGIATGMTGIVCCLLTPTQAGAAPDAIRGFVGVEPFELRLEALVRVEPFRDTWGLESGVLGAVERAAVLEKTEELFASGVKVRVPGAVPSFTERTVRFIVPDAEKGFVPDERDAIPLGEALVGLTFSAAARGVSELELDWLRFGPGQERLVVEIASRGKPSARVLTPAENTMRWRQSGGSVLPSLRKLPASETRETRPLRLLLVPGLAMALGLYDSCFAALGQVEPRRYRRAVSGVTLVAGFASTVCWPASHYLLQSTGWRGLCDVYAVVLCLCALIYFAVLPRAHPTIAHPTIAHNSVSIEHSGVAPDVSVRRRARLLAWTFAGAALIGASMSAHLPGVLRALELSAEQAVWAASSVGVMQVLGRMLELGFGSKRDPVRLGLLTLAGFFVSMLLLLVLPAAPWLVVAFAVFYGIANGLLTIAKATLPVQMLGLRNVGSVLGDFSMPSLIARAFAPLWFAMTTSALGTRAAVLSMATVGLATLASYTVMSSSKMES